MNCEFCNELTNDPITILIISPQEFEIRETGPDASPIKLQKLYFCSIDCKECYTQQITTFLFY